MHTVKIVVWDQDGIWMGYFQEYPDYWTQGENLDDLKEHLKDLHADLPGSLSETASPDWHGEILLQRLAAPEEGQTAFIEWESAKERLGKRQNGHSGHIEDHRR
jgi:predicted RNase H-like HicB family nuclease